MDGGEASSKTALINYSARSIPPAIAHFPEPPKQNITFIFLNYLENSNSYIYHRENYGDSEY